MRVPRRGHGVVVIDIVNKYTDLLTDFSLCTDPQPLHVVEYNTRLNQHFLSRISVAIAWLHGVTKGNTPEVIVVKATPDIKTKSPASNHGKLSFSTAFVCPMFETPALSLHQYGLGYMIAIYFPLFGY